MWSKNKIKEYLKENTSENRYIHILGVVETSQSLADRYGADRDKAALAAYIHDAAKHLPGDKLIKLIEDKGFKLTSEDKAMPQLLHGPAGAIIAEELMGIKDREVLDAARYHTTGKENMNLLEKIVYIADLIEPSRDYPGVKHLRELALKDIDKALLQAFDNTIKHIIDRGLLIHSDTIKSRNYIIVNKK
ncbi:bis(5'-nucleosyl)-tetraphosphatase (symmetrical) YqeK [Clostridium polynesiense]|uniref:bis(5'-nucleosyl)-tetraphosphatase (symmetrical) YqeK n=1 Tax=Clostridium polynesiense TaxID=1325933 RepID=UPI0005903715|nr:bis(5'-nucleosyl)-tetraphosphatase (symmetrical) YqeK [Clostridium polynesiense]